MRNRPCAILAIGASAFGQSLFLLPAIKAIRASYPESFIAAAASTGTCQLLAASRTVSEAIDLGVILPSSSGFGEALKRFSRLMKRAGRNRFDLVLDFSPRLETQLACLALKGGWSLRLMRLPDLMHLLLTFSKQQAQADEAASMLRRLGINLSDLRPHIEPAPEESRRFEELLARHGSHGGEPLVVLYATDAMWSRGWPVENFARLATYLANNFQARIIVADTPADSRFTCAICGLLPAGSIKLTAPSALQLVAAIARASLVVTDDAGLAALAAELGAPSLEIRVWTYGLAPKTTHRVIQCASRMISEEVYVAACELLQMSRTEQLFQRST
jgi:ADP-heptose:LPS heptosyltransferase